MSTDPDEQLIGELRTIAERTDPVPEHVNEAARAAFETRSLDELAELLLDSDAMADTGTRGPGQTRLLSFAAGDVGIDLQVDTGRGTATVRGLVRDAAGPVQIEGADGIRTEVEVDEDGLFVARGVALGRTRLRVASAGVTTQWFTL